MQVSISCIHCSANVNIEGGVEKEGILQQTVKEKKRKEKHNKNKKEKGLVIIRTGRVKVRFVEMRFPYGR